jgi:hypothetical protein
MSAFPARQPCQRSDDWGNEPPGTGRLRPRYWPQPEKLREDSLIKVPAVASSLDSGPSAGADPAAAMLPAAGAYRRHIGNRIRAGNTTAP